MDLSKLSYTSYWFSLNPGASFGFLYHTLIFCTALLILALGLSFWLHYKAPQKILKKYLVKIRSRLYTFASIGYLLTFFRHEGAYFLSMRFWWGLWLIFFTVSAAQICLDIFKNYPADLRAARYKEKSKRYQARGNK